MLRCSNKLIASAALTVQEGLRHTSQSVGGRGSIAGAQLQLIDADTQTILTSDVAEGDE